MYLGELIGCLIFGYLGIITFSLVVRKVVRFRSKFIRALAFTYLDDYIERLETKGN